MSSKLQFIVRPLLALSAWILFPLVWFLRLFQSSGLLRIFDRYSAIVVVFCAAIVVTGTNVSKESKIHSLLTLVHRTQQEPLSGIQLPAPRKDTLAMAPLQPATAPVDTETLIDIEEVQEVLLPEEPEAPVAQVAIAKEPEQDGGVTLYEVQHGDTLSEIAQAHDISVNTILWANEVDDVDEIKPGDTIFILPIAGLQHTVKDGDTIDKIAEEYEAEKEQIIAFNELPANGEIEAGQEIIIPGGEKELPVQLQDPVEVLDRRMYVAAGNGTLSNTAIKNKETKRKSGNRFPYGYCTYYVAQKRHVPWRGNAGAWLYNAKAMGYKTGKKAKKGSIVVTTDDSYYGHVAYVEKVKDNSIVVSEMNYNGWGKVNKREIAMGSRSIRGYIY